MTGTHRQAHEAELCQLRAYGALLHDNSEHLLDPSLQIDPPPHVFEDEIGLRLVQDRRP